MGIEIARRRISTTQMHHTLSFARRLTITSVRAGFLLTVLTVDGPIQVKLPCNLDDDMNIVIENKGVPTSEGRGIHHVNAVPSHVPASVCATHFLFDVLVSSV